MSEKLGNFTYLGLSGLFLACAVYVQFCLKDLKLKLFYATLYRHSQTSQPELKSRWVVAANKALEKKLDTQVDSRSLIDWNDQSKWLSSNSNLSFESLKKFRAHDHSRYSWKSNTVHALLLIINAERSFLGADYVECAQIIGNLLKREAYAKQLLRGDLPAFVSNEYNVYKTSDLMSKDSYGMLMDAIESDVSNNRQAFRGFLYYRLFLCYANLSDYRRSRRSLELCLEELGWEIVQKFMGSNRAVLQSLHPRPYWPFVENLGYYFSFDPFLLYSIMSVESGFDPTKESSAGACGLMQVMPRTAQSLSRGFSESQLKGYGLSYESIQKAESFDCKKLKEIQLNIHLAAMFLSELQFKYNEARFIVASYNAGETVVRKWFEKSQQEKTSFMNEVKFKETYRYISKVLTDWLKYRSVYDGRGFTAQNVRYVNLR